MNKISLNVFFFLSQSKEGSILFDSDLAEITQTQVILEFWPSFFFSFVVWNQTFKIVVKTKLECGEGFFLAPSF